jgi:hypothetical protein
MAATRKQKKRERNAQFLEDMGVRLGLKERACDGPNRLREQNRRVDFRKRRLTGAGSVA